MRLDLEHNATPLEQLTASAPTRATGVEFAGTFNPIRSYRAHRHVVKHSGTSWTCVVDCINQKPHPKSKYWHQISEKGLKGSSDQVAFQRSKDVARKAGQRLANELFKQATGSVELDELGANLIRRFEQKVEQYSEDVKDAI